ncbi:MAG TPA: hypothetical protein VGV39_19855 [Mesorhizobium sp.]|jgi:hypothetical protein|uniref:hypothetical protein n=1 Tax=Mesorhizobium sp. TaxID=1871066 RepID=UPI002DDD2183|nr:hypothetical protein [Mesorhizobium sp.]HEV2505341.1 hypothetical protein [Mesorhizobium sp.]
MTVSSTAIRGLSYSDDVDLLRQIFQDFRVDERVQSGNLAAEEVIAATLGLFAQGKFKEVEIRVGLGKFLAARSN